MFHDYPSLQYRSRYQFWIKNENGVCPIIWEILMTSTVHLAGNLSWPTYCMEQKKKKDLTHCTQNVSRKPLHLPLHWIQSFWSAVLRNPPLTGPQLVLVVDVVTKYVFFLCNVPLHRSSLRDSLQTPFCIASSMLYAFHLSQESATTKIDQTSSNPK